MCGRGSDDRLPAECRGRNFGGDWSAGIGGAAIAVAYVGDVFSGAGAADSGQSSRSEGGGVGVHRSYLFVCGNADGGDCDWAV